MRGCAALLVFALAGCGRERPVLLYHAVGCGTTDPLDVPLGQFIDELDAARAAGFTFVPLDRLVAAEGELPPKPLGLSCDDGARCIYEVAFPELRRRAIPFTVFLPARWLQASHIQEVNEHTRWVTMGVPDVREMLASGLAEVGSHGLDHLRLPGLDASASAAEVADSAALLGAWFPVAPTLFAYPFGSFGRREVAEVKRMGYRGAFGVSVGAGGRYAYRRRSIHAGLDRQGFLSQLSDRWVVLPFAHD